MGWIRAFFRRRKLRALIRELPYGTAMQQLVELGVDAVPALSESVKSQDPMRAKKAAQALAAIGPAAAAAVPSLIDALRKPPSDHRFEVMEYVVKALEQIGPGAAPAIDSLHATVRWMTTDIQIDEKKSEFIVSTDPKKRTITAGIRGMNDVRDAATKAIKIIEEARRHAMTPVSAGDGIFQIKCSNSDCGMIIALDRNAVPSKATGLKCPRCNNSVPIPQIF